MASDAQEAGVAYRRGLRNSADRVNTEVADTQLERLAALRTERDSAAAEAALAKLRETASGEGNLMPPILEAVKAYATLGEICGELREVFGEYRAATAV